VELIGMMLGDNMKIKKPMVVQMPGIGGASIATNFLEDHHRT
jgi:hypothetical protein